MLFDGKFTKENLDDCLRTLGKEFRRLNGNKMKAEITLIGGASILVNYDFREMTYDVDAIIQASSAMKEAINRVSDSLELPNGWLNSDFIRTDSYSPRLMSCSKYYKTFSNVLTVRTVSGEYLIAMKLMAGRKYKNDISDIVGILWEESKKKTPIGMEQIDKAVCDLYGSWDGISEEMRSFIKELVDNENLQESYSQYRESEKEIRYELLDLKNEDNSSTVREDNISAVLSALRHRIK